MHLHPVVSLVYAVGPDELGWLTREELPSPSLCTSTGSFVVWFNIGLALPVLMILYSWRSEIQNLRDLNAVCLLSYGLPIKLYFTWGLLDIIFSTAVSSCIYVQPGYSDKLY